VSELLEQQLKKWIAAFESLSNAVLSSSSPKSYQELFDFFSTHLSCEQVYFWKKEFQKDPDVTGRTPKQKFLSLNKASLEEFDDLSKKFETLQFNQRGFYASAPHLFVKVNIENEYYGFVFKGFPKEILEEDVVLSFFLARLSGVLSLVDRFEKTQSLNYVDDVTGLYNQRYLNVLLDQEIERYKRNSQSFSILFIDVDHFKNVNDKNGHLVGSQVLKEIGAILKKSVRAVDFCFRYGGDEFIVVLTGTSTETATMVAERVCRAVRETSFLVSGVTVQVTLSIGVANFPEHAKTKEKILQVADEAMYCGKNLSRNIVYLAS